MRSGEDFYRHYIAMKIDILWAVCLAHAGLTREEQNSIVEELLDYCEEGHTIAEEGIKEVEIIERIAEIAWRTPRNWRQPRDGVYK